MKPVFRSVPSYLGPQMPPLRSARDGTYTLSERRKSWVFPTFCQKCRRCLNFTISGVCWAELSGLFGSVFVASGVPQDMHVSRCRLAKQQASIRSIIQ